MEIDVRFTEYVSTAWMSALNEVTRAGRNHHYGFLVGGYTALTFSQSLFQFLLEVSDLHPVRANILNSKAATARINTSPFPNRAYGVVPA